MSDKYDELARESVNQQSKNELLQGKQIELIESLQDRIKLLETQLSETSSPRPFSPTSTSDLGEETGAVKTDKVSYLELEKENEKLLEKIDKLQLENNQLKQEMVFTLILLSESHIPHPPNMNILLL